MWTAFIFGTFIHLKLSLTGVYLTDFDQIKESILLVQTSIIAYMTFCKNLGLVTTFKLALNSTFHISMIPPLAEFVFYMHY